MTFFRTHAPRGGIDFPSVLLVALVSRFVRGGGVWASGPVEFVELFTRWRHDFFMRLL